MAEIEFQTLIQLPESRRDDAWENQFLDAMINRRVGLVQPEPQAGPDGWPYLPIQTTGGDEPFARIVDWCASRGIGLVVNPHKMVPDYVFTYGMLWNFKETGRFLTPARLRPAGDFDLPKDAVIGEPSAQYLPSFVRQILREFLKGQQFLRPKILVVSNADFSETDLVLSIDSLNDLAANQHAILAEALAWFLPTHYHLVFAREAGLPKFFDL